MVIMTDVKIPVQVIGINPDADQITGEQYTQITLAKETTFNPAQPQLPISPRVTGWKYILHLFIANDKWDNQYKMWQKFDLIVKNTGELELKLS